MSNINLADAKVTYEGQELPAINLISKLQTQLQEAACQIASIASTLGDLQASLLNSNTVEVKLTLSKEDFGRFRTLGGIDDNERIRNAVMAVIHPEEAALPARTAEFRPVIAKNAEPVLPNNFEVSPGEPTLSEQPLAVVPPFKKASTTKCPRCQSMIDLPEVSHGQWSVEVKCGTCDAKYLVKSKTLSA